MVIKDNGIWLDATDLYEKKVVFNALDETLCWCSHLYCATKTYKQSENYKHASPEWPFFRYSEWIIHELRRKRVNPPLNMKYVYTYLLKVHFIRLRKTILNCFSMLIQKIATFDPKKVIVDIRCYKAILFSNFAIENGKLIRMVFCKVFLRKGSARGLTTYPVSLLYAFH